MTREPDLATSSGQATDELPPGPPTYLKLFALLSIPVAVALAYFNFKAATWTFWAIGAGHTPDRIMFALLVEMLVYLGVGLLFICGGFLLAFDLKAGRFFTMLAAILCFFGYLVSWIAASMMASALKNNEVGSTRMGAGAYDFGGSWGLWAATMFFAIFVIVFFLLPGVRKWVKARPLSRTDK